MSAEIVNSGRGYITDKLAGNLPTTINRFILANVPHSDPNTPVDLDEPMPSSEQVVYDEPITRSAKINVDEVVFSQILLSDVGDFDFNWVGLAADDNTLIAVVYVPLQHKRKYVGNQTGNSITRNVVLKLSHAAAALGVTISPETWQFDFTDLIHSEVSKANQYALLSETSLEIQYGTLNAFSAHADIPLGKVKDGLMFTAKVLSTVDLEFGDCAFLAPEGETIKQGSQAFNKARLVENDAEFRFMRINGEWHV